MFKALTSTQEEIICSVLGDAETHGLDDIDTVESIAFFLHDTGMDQPTALAIAREVVNGTVH